MANKERNEKDIVLDIVEDVRKIFYDVGVEGRFSTYAKEKPFLVEVFFTANLHQVVKIMEKCEEKYESRAELGITSAEPLPAPCTIFHEYFLDITCE